MPTRRPPSIPSWAVLPEPDNSSSYGNVSDDGDVDQLHGSAASSQATQKRKAPSPLGPSPSRRPSKKSRQSTTQLSRSTASESSAARSNRIIEEDRTRKWKESQSQKKKAKEGAQGGTRGRERAGVNGSGPSRLQSGSTSPVLSRSKNKAPARSAQTPNQHRAGSVIDISSNSEDEPSLAGQKKRFRKLSKPTPVAQKQARPSMRPPLPPDPSDVIVISSDSEDGDAGAARSAAASRFNKMMASSNSPSASRRLPPASASTARRRVSPDDDDDIMIIPSASPQPVSAPADVFMNSPEQHTYPLFIPEDDDDLAPPPQTSSEPAERVDAAEEIDSPQAYVPISDAAEDLNLLPSALEPENSPASGDSDLFRIDAQDTDDPGTSSRAVSLSLRQDLDDEAESDTVRTRPRTSAPSPADEPSPDAAAIHAARVSSETHTHITPAFSPAEPPPGSSSSGEASTTRSSPEQARAPLKPVRGALYGGASGFFKDVYRARRRSRTSSAGHPSSASASVSASPEASTVLRAARGPGQGRMFSGAHNARTRRISEVAGKDEGRAAVGDVGNVVTAVQGRDGGAGAILGSGIASSGNVDVLPQSTVVPREGGRSFGVRVKDSVSVQGREKEAASQAAGNQPTGQPQSENVQVASTSPSHGASELHLPASRLLDQGAQQQDSNGQSPAAPASAADRPGRSLEELVNGLWLGHKRKTLPAVPQAQTQTQAQAQPEVIDLTMDDDDDASGPPAPAGDVSGAAGVPASSAAAADNANGSGSAVQRERASDEAAPGGGASVRTQTQTQGQVDRQSPSRSGQPAATQPAPTNSVALHAVPATPALSQPSATPAGPSPVVPFRFLQRPQRRSSASETIARLRYGLKLRGSSGALPPPASPTVHRLPSVQGGAAQSSGPSAQRGGGGGGSGSPGASGRPSSPLKAVVTVSEAFSAAPSGVAAPPSLGGPPGGEAVSRVAGSVSSVAEMPTSEDNAMDVDEPVVARSRREPNAERSLDAMDALPAAVENVAATSVSGGAADDLCEDSAVEPASAAPDSQSKARPEPVKSAEAVAAGELSPSASVPISGVASSSRAEDANVEDAVMAAVGDLSIAPADDELEFLELEYPESTTASSEADASSERRRKGKSRQSRQSSASASSVVLRRSKRQSAVAPKAYISRASTSRTASRASSDDPLDLLSDPIEPATPDSEPISTPAIFQNSNRGVFNDFVLDGISVIALTPERLMAEFPPAVYYAKDLPHMLQDRMNALAPDFRRTDMARAVFESMIEEGTADDEPDAPRIYVVNDVDDDVTPPWEFHYSNHMWHTDGVEPPDLVNLRGCGCVGPCNPKSKTCSCVARQREHMPDGVEGFVYDEKRRLKFHDYPIFECNDLCGCPEECKNRVVQHGRRCEIDIRKTEKKGWGVFARSRIPAGMFVGIYAGELLTDEEGDERGEKYNKFGRTYLFGLDFWYLRGGDTSDNWDPKYVVDAYHAGNFTRFLNHSCDPNCVVNPCYINEANMDKPLLTIFTSREIDPDEELCFSYYGPMDDSDDESAAAAQEKNDAVYVKCCCGAARCRRSLFN